MDQWENTEGHGRGPAGTDAGEDDHMDVPRQSEYTSEWGRVTVEVLDDKTLAPGRPPEGSASLGRSRYTWQPPPEIEDQLPQGFCLSLDCLAGSDCVRRFVPGSGAAAFILQASLGGSALLARRAVLGGLQRFSYHVMRLLYQQAPGLREHLGRTFRRERDLYTPRAGRIGGDGAHVLPPELGPDEHGRGKPWTPGELIEEGRREAADAGDTNPDGATCIRLGLAAAARRNPLDPATVSEAGAR